MAKPEIVALARKAIKGDRDAFEELCMRKSKDLIYNAMGILGDYHEAEDAAQDAIISMYMNIGKLRVPETIEVWMLRIVRNRCYRILEKGADRRTESDIDDETIAIVDDDREFVPEQYAEDAEMSTQLYEIVLGLPQKKREAILLYYYDDMSYKEIASVQGTSINTVSTNISRARAMIQKRLEEKGNINDIKLGAGVAMPVLSRVLKQEVDKQVPDRAVTAFQLKWKESLAPIKYPAGEVKFFLGSAVTFKSAMIAVISVAVVVTSIITGVFVLGSETPKDAPDVRGEVIFTNESSDFAQLNPESATLVGIDLDEAKMPGWRIASEATGEVYKEGEGDTLSAELKQMRTSAKPGEYVLIFSVINRDGYRIEVERAFEIGALTE
jgi:RNA polymerase sigma-70 factor (ECF subfamily)